MKNSNDYLLLKWGTIKGFCFKNSPEAYEALKEYYKIGVERSAIFHKDTPRQKELLCIMIDKVNGDIQNDITGEIYKRREDAKRYVIEYKIIEI